jgi:nucleoside-diphosphate-sugar epimerase
MLNAQKILVCGAGGYVGSKLVESLIDQGFSVVAFDTYWYHRLSHGPELQIVEGDICTFDFSGLLKEIDQVILLASISNDPSFDLDPELSKKVNYDATIRFYDQVMNSTVKRFIFASSSSVYGVKTEENVTENLPLEPMTPYAVYKALAEQYFLSHRKNELDLVILRPATVCGPSPRLRLDLVTNLLTAQAFYKKKICIHGGGQHRPQLNMNEMVRAYVNCVQHKNLFNGEIFNVGEINYTVKEIADLIVGRMNADVEYVIEPILDNRSYRINSEKYYAFFETAPMFFLKDAVDDLISFFNQNPALEINDPLYHNVKFMNQLHYE